ncbi:GFA family protein [Bradyrhizobium elkanii]|uniref:GFA family protein n=1 Tax=Bradyrhizobium elkanii TaxID=29448 RepID=UPI003D1D7A72
MRIDGQCHCGAITYQAEIDPERVSICHCTDCQALTGSPYRVTVICAAEQVWLTAGAPNIYRKRGDNGRIRFQHFCGDCGSPLFTSGENGVPDDWGIRWGSIRQRDRLPPRRQVWCRSAAPWINDLKELPARPKDWS